MDKNMDLKLMQDKDYYGDDAELFHRYRRSPPDDFIPIILQLYGKTRVELVIDLGCGTGLSSFIWRKFTNKIIGIEPKKNHILVARKKNTSENIHFIETFSDKTGLDSAAADIVTAVNSLHWMDLKSTFNEIYRLLKPGGLFVMLGALGFTILDFEVNKKFNQISDNANRILKDNGYNKELKLSAPEQIDKYMYNQKYLKNTLEFVLLGREKLTVNHFIGRFKTLVEIATCIKKNVDEILGQVTNFQKYLEKRYQDKAIDYFTSYDMKIGCK